MINAIATLFADKFIKNNIIPESQRNIFIYGVNITFGKYSCLLSLLIVSLLFHNLIGSLIFYSGFLLTRKFCGGYHASTHFRCNLMSIINVLLYLFATVFFSSYYSVLTTLFLSYSVISIIIFSPVDHPNKPFTKGEFNHFRKCCLKLSSIYFLFLILTFFIENFKLLFFSFSFGIMSATTAMLFAKYLNFKRKDVTHEKA